MVGVLVFIDHDVAESPLVLIEDCLIVFEKANRIQQQIIKIHGVVFLQFPLITVVYAVDHILSVSGTECRAIGLRRDFLLLAIADLTEERTDRELLFIDLFFLDDRLDNGFAVHRIIDSKRITVT